VRLPPKEREALRILLENAQAEYVARGEIFNDALGPAFDYKNPRDQEMVALICAVLAYGRVQQIQLSIRKLLQPWGTSPTTALTQASIKDVKEATRGWAHRFNSSSDGYHLLVSLGEIYKQSGTLESSLQLQPEDSANQILEKLVQKIEDHLPERPNPSFWYLFPRPSRGSACKRLNLFLRWMVGQSKTDLALWKSVSTKNLIIPVDTHIHRQALSLGLTKRKANDWKTAEEITAALRFLDPQDPTRFDFALCHLGINGKILKRSDLR
jgi:uncharacterized protein (TIGR02757 family)